MSPRTPSHGAEPPTRIGIIMGSESDWETMRGAADILTEFGCAHEIEIVSAHRTPERLYEYARSAVERGLAAIIAGAGGAAHLPGMVSSLTPLPVLGVPVKSQALAGLDSLLSIVQMPAGVPTATFAIGVAGAKNAALFCVRMLALHDARLRELLIEFRDREIARVEAGSARLQSLTKAPKEP